MTTEEMEQENREAEALDTARAAYPHLEIVRAAECGCCDNCGAEGTAIYDTPINWLCAVCLKDYAEEEPSDGR